MKIGGLQKISLQDYPGHICAILFTQGCLFRCGFCHNPELVDPKQFETPMNLDEIIHFLKSRIHKLDAVTITGGEPTIHHDIVDFIQEIRNLGYKIKLDTSGIRPDVLEKLLELELLDYIAMDIKSKSCSYNLVSGMLKLDFALIQKSIELIIHSGVDYEFRTTLIKGIHKINDVPQMAHLIKGARKYYLQKYRNDTKILDENFRGFNAFTDDEMQTMADTCQGIVQKCLIR